MSIRVVATYKLKPDADADEFETWSRNVDMPYVRGVPGFIEFDVFRSEVDGLYVEVFTLRDETVWETFKKDAGLQSLVSEFGAFVDSQDVTVHRLTAL